MFLKCVACEFRELHPEVFPDEIFPPTIEQLFRLAIDEGEFPISINREKAVAGFFENVGHFVNGFLQLGAGLVAFH